MLKMSPFCVVEITRQRQKQSLRQSTYVECPVCHGTGHVKGPETLALQALRQIRAGIEREGLASVRITAPPPAANYLNNEMRRRLHELSESTGKEIRVVADVRLDPGEYSVEFLSSDGRQLAPP